MDEHRKFLADRLLSDEQPITYRLLSRALDVHVNTAKEMLYDFLQYQNGIKENSIHATYLLYGQKKAQEAHEDGDVEMGSSQPEQNDSTSPVVTETLTLVAEESLKAILAEYEKVTSINVYSLAPHPQKDLSLLSDISRAVAEYTAKEDPLEAPRKYGAITNPSVRRRDRSGKSKAAAPSTSTKTVKTEPQASKAVKPEPTPAATASKPTQAAKIKQEATEPTSKDSTPTSSAGKSSTPALKRGSSGGIMQSFAKAANKPKPAPKKKQEEDTAMALSDDGEADDTDLPATKKQTKEEAESLRKAKKEREEQLKKMMEEDDEEEEEEQEKEDEEMEDAPEPEPEPEPVEEKKAEEPAEVVASTGDGRRRGKRRVTKKKRILDDQGYMVTINEEGWESFSEEDKPPPAKKQTPNPTPTSSGAKAKKPAGKAGQGNIMSFFGKK